MALPNFIGIRLDAVLLGKAIKLAVHAICPCVAGPTLSFDALPRESLDVGSDGTNGSPCPPLLGRVLDLHRGEARARHWGLRDSCRAPRDPVDDGRLRTVLEDMWKGQRTEARRRQMAFQIPHASML